MTLSPHAGRLGAAAAAVMMVPPLLNVLSIAKTGSKYKTRIYLPVEAAACCLLDLIVRFSTIESFVWMTRFLSSV